jgi:hypothetical protein
MHRLVLVTRNARISRNHQAPREKVGAAKQVGPEQAKPVHMAAQRFVLPDHRADHRGGHRGDADQRQQRDREAQGVSSSTRALNTREPISIYWPWGGQTRKRKSGKTQKRKKGWPWKFQRTRPGDSGSGSGSGQGFHRTPRTQIATAGIASD